MRKVSLLLGILCVLYVAEGISIKMDRNKNYHCCKVEVPNDSILEGSFLVSGQSEKETTLRVFPHLECLIDIQSDFHAY